MSALRKFRRTVIITILVAAIPLLYACGGGSSARFFNELCAVLVRSGVLVAGDSHGRLFRSSDSGMNFSELVTPTSAGITGFSYSDGVGLGSLSNGRIIKSTDLGINWKLIDTGHSLKLNGIAFVNEPEGSEFVGTFVTVGNGGWIGSSNDLGDTWHFSKVAENDLLGISCFDRMCYTVGRGGALYETHDGGQNWKPGNSGTTVDLYGVQILDDEYAWAVGGPPATISYKINGSWIEHTNVNFGTGKTPSVLRSVYFADKMNGLVAGDGNLIYRSSDSGLNFEGVSGLSNLIATFALVKFLTGGLIFGGSPNEVYAGGDRGLLLYSPDLFSTFKDYRLENTLDSQKNTSGSGDDDDDDLVGDDDDDSGSSSSDSSGDTSFSVTGLADFSLSTSLLTIEHKKTSQCPQDGGAVTVTNNSEFKQSIEVKPVSGPVTVSKSMFDLGPMAQGSFNVFFTCNKPEDQNGSIKISAQNYFTGTDTLDSASEHENTLSVKIDVKF
ncbi:MAG: hypothetical protein D6719_02020 [Candidatus Dadabacteria bacterium]|nr:MAG: hypothetical protein D6719_02020 [Candidatus Dadabacteria bacterium]